ALALLHAAVANAQEVDSSKPRGGAVVAALGLEDFSPDAIMDASGHAPEYRRSHDSKPVDGQQHIQPNSNRNFKTYDKQAAPRGAIAEAAAPEGGDEAQGDISIDDRIAKIQKWLSSPYKPRKSIRRPSNTDNQQQQQPGGGAGGGTPRHDVYHDPCARIASSSTCSGGGVPAVKGAAGDGVSGGEDEDEEEDCDADTMEAQRAWGRVRTKMTDREFHDGLSRILLKARDGHLSYDADCFRAFRFQHGFFMSHVVRDSKTIVKVHSAAPYFPYQNGVKEDILNCDVLTIDGRDAVDYIQDCADRHVPMSMFNAVLATPQYRSGTADFFLSGKFSERFTLPTEKSLMFTFRCPTNKNLRLNVKWVGFYTHEQTKPFTNADSYFTANCVKNIDDLFGNEDDEGKVGRGRSKMEKQEDAEKKDITELKSTLRDLLFSQSVPSGPADTVVTGPAPDSPPSGVHPLTNNGASLPPLSPAKELSKSVDEIVSKLDMISSEQLPVVKFYGGYGGRVSELNRGMSVLPFKELYEGKHGITA
ncbi:hypothetical protein BGX23_003940, partial [Mortierella sp. AD031]